MTKPEAIKLLNKLPYTGMAGGLIFTDWYTYKPENLRVLRDCVGEVIGLKIYEDIQKFRLIRSIN